MQPLQGHLLPFFFGRIRVSDQSNLMMIYRRRTEAPGATQLQTAVNNSNPLYLTTGNPSLDQSEENFFLTRFSHANTEKSNSFFVFLLGRQANQYIGNATYIASQDSVLENGVVLSRGAQISQPVNLDGYWNIRSLVTYGMPLSFMKTNLNLTGGVTYVRTPGMINGETNLSNNTGVNGGVVLSSNISEKVDFTLIYTLNFNNVRNSVQAELDQRYTNQVIDVQTVWIFGPGIVFRNSLNYQRYRGLADAFNEDFILWNVSLGKKLFKNQRGELSLRVFDLLNQNNSISRQVTETYIEDVRNDVLNRYFMLGFFYNIRKFNQENQLP